MGKGKDTSKRDAEILRLVAEGHSERQIASLVGCSRATVWYVKQRAVKPSWATR